MCHGAAVAAFPVPATATDFSSDVEGYHYAGSPDGRRIAILPDIYGCNPFYQGLATLLANRGANVYLVDPFAEFGALPEMTRDAAFARRHKVADTAYIDRFERFVGETNIAAVIGFCLGGLYVFELARRGVDCDLLGLYGFPQGMQNQDPLPVPFDYLPSVTQPFTMMMGADDHAVGVEHVARLADMAPAVPAMNLVTLTGVGHNFLPLLDSEDAALRETAKVALRHIEQLVG